MIEVTVDVIYCNDRPLGSYDSQVKRQQLLLFQRRLWTLPLFLENQVSKKVVGHL
ncbi:hypothetical protein [Salipaludibacillus daqingensis]|uniref:hypothetical protein n=1 Tax=Salipaludibacillus daqingensis TaxID=3041001 RepID=UPI0024754FE0|nr:hypothetical protein [Salipaludibacillus daqingensis]